MSKDKMDLLTEAVCHTEESLLTMYPDQAKVILPKLKEIFGLLFGTKDQPKAIWDDPLLRLNYRAKGTERDPTRGDGSFNTASTLLQGNGRGVIIPAAQSTDPNTRSRLATINRLTYEVYHHIMPLSLSKEEWEVSCFRMEDVNTIVVGGIGAGPTSIQLNVFICKGTGR